ncbi:protein-glutamate O-methyltransferase CheR [Celeribacter arenosi]|uniref:Chemotaxis protein methyltransferase n=1 Tax=Celeribacter arenosi TaxID=792649 RepID=A0ABP7KHY7_9RHOB
MNALAQTPLTGAIESDISDRAFARIARIAEREAGLQLSKSKVSMIKSRLTRRLRALRITTFDAYLDYLENAEVGEEMSAFISALTTNVSHFFREEHHFKFLTEVILPKIRPRLESNGRLRIWSAGCSNGQEAYSIAITLLKFDPSLANKDVRILATDIDPEVLETARRGAYTGTLISGLDESTKDKFFDRSMDCGVETLTAHANLKNLIRFNKLNLHGNWPMKQSFDVIFCRNVIIYFDAAAQSKLFDRFAHALEPNGWMMLGHSERLSSDKSDVFTSCGITTYQVGKSRESVTQNDTQDRGLKTWH